MGALVGSFTAIGWDRDAGRYVPFTAERGDPDFRPHLAHLGRAFVVDVTLCVERDTWLRCVSDVSARAREVVGRGLAELVDAAGRVEVLWFPYIDRTWVKTWTPSWGQSFSRPAVQPYNYPFSDNIPGPVADLTARIVKGRPELAPELVEAQHAAITWGLAATGAGDLVGPSKNVLLYAKPSMLRYSLGGWTVLTRRADLGEAASRFADIYRSLLNDYKERGLYPVNGPVELRVTGLDPSPSLAACAPDPDNPNFDTALWINVATLPGSLAHATFFTELERRMFCVFRPPLALIRVEWSKGWAYGPRGAWSSRAMLTETIPATCRRAPRVRSVEKAGL
ncbi:hypothetical protein E1281_36330 [Actinomadura sp. KC345]|uniref:cholesterol oxidase substrate-binding domain-containing protein n=1 Tax=Actinomadura sp. KC345 TaxID=2530371 RepID=UPI0010469A63|nr:cholesterol oxidase substrate-binding domain-containing protein [Actinomadura sp. KC345]TDC42321.1 hypothetical protein E1281_36330 [Actinomadura sp. KC345]